MQKLNLRKQLDKEKYGYVRPVCVCNGCVKPVRAQSKALGYKPRPMCSHCLGASQGKWDYAKGVNPFLTGICSNADGRLGFKCYTSTREAKRDGVRLSMHIDHINGNSFNNSPDNCQELCPVCHTEKGKRSGDHNKNRM